MGESSFENVVSKEKLDRINELARKSKIGELTAEEKEEQKELRSEFILNFREGFKRQLEQIELVPGAAVDNTRKQ